MLARINKRYVPAYWDDFFNDNFFRGFSYPEMKNSTPSVNVVEEDKAYFLELAVPGMSRKDIRIEVEDDVLNISSERKEKKEGSKRNYTRREFSFESFHRSFQLPETVDSEKIQASFDAGILTIEIPKKEEVVSKAPKQIEIK